MQDTTCVYLTLPDRPGVIFLVTHPENVTQDKLFKLRDGGNTIENKHGYIVGHRVTRQRQTNTNQASNVHYHINY